jgi:hypothetical protein
MFNSPLSFLPQLEDGEKYTNIAINWPDGKIKQKKWDENYSLINFGDVGKINLKLYEKR